MITSVMAIFAIPLLLLGGIGYQSSFTNFEIWNDNSTSITPDGLKDTLYFAESEFIQLEFSSNTDVIKIINNYTIPTPSSTELGGVFAKSCSSNMYVSGIDVDGNLICQSLP